MLFESASDDEIITDLRQHAFPVAIAMKYSMSIALWLQHLAFWTENNLALNKNIYDGLCWSYITLEALGDKFPYMSKSQRETMINNSISAGLVVKGNYNHTKYDRTVWYALTPKAYAYFSHFLEEKYLKRLYLSISEKSEMDFIDFRNLFPKNRTPIPDTKPDTKNNNICASNDAQKIFDYTLTTKNAKSDYLDNHDEGIKNQENRTQVLEAKGNPVKSDYFENQSIICTQSINRNQSTLEHIKNTNIFSIPTEMIDDWIATRKTKRLGINKTAWNHITKVLTELKEKGIEPHEAFERMVANGWHGIEISYFRKDDTPKTKTETSVNHSPLTPEEDRLLRDYRHICKNRFPISETLKAQVNGMRLRLKSIDHPIAREALSEIQKLSDIHAGNTLAKTTSTLRPVNLLSTCFGS